MTFTVTLTGGVVVEVYGGLTACDAYLLGAIGPGATAYLVLPANGDARKRLLIAATRYIDRQRWQGEPNGAGGTTLKWPRDGLADDPTNEEQLALVNQAAFELAAIFAVTPDVYSAIDQGENIKSMGAGSARIEFFSPTKPGGGATKLPAVLSELIGKWLAGSGEMPLASGAPSSTGTCGSSTFDRCDEHKRNEPF